MSNPKPLGYGKYYHIYNRGNNREDIFIEEKNNEYFMRLYSKYIPVIADTYAYCLLGNHFHLLVRVRSEQEIISMFKLKTSQQLPIPSRQFSNLFNAYTKSINKMYKRTGSLFQRPFQRRVVDSNAYLIHLVRYIHQNPQIHGLVDNFRDWPYSSYMTILSTETSQLARDEILEWFDGKDNFLQAHKELTDPRLISQIEINEFE